MGPRAYRSSSLHALWHSRSTRAALLVIGLAIGSCSPRTSAGDPPTSPVVVPGSGPGGQMTVGELRQRLMTFADLAMGEMARASAAALARDSTPTTRAFVQTVQAQVAATSLTLAVESDPETALQDLMVSLAAERASLALTPADAPGPAAMAILDTTLGRLENDIWSIGESTYPATELAGLRARLKSWRESAVSSPAGVVRVADLPADASPQMSKGLFAPLNEANRQIEESRLLGERFLFLAERLPVVTLWQAEAVTWEVLAAPESRRALDGLETMSATLARLALQVDSLPALMDEQREALFAAFDAREATARALMSAIAT